MDIQLILGPNNSGKSLLAESLAADTGSSLLFYLATMIPQNEENYSRIEKHRLQRAQKGFITIEAGWDIHTLNIPDHSVVLLEDASNLLANGIFMHQKNASDCFNQILSLAEKCRKLFIVSISGLVPGPYDENTNYYIEQLNQLNQLLENASSDCIKK